MNDQVTAQEWFSTGTRVTYDPVSKKMVERAKNADVVSEIHVWKRVERDAAREVVPTRAGSAKGITERKGKP